MTIVSDLAIVVEDDPQSAEIYVAAIQEAGYRTELITDGQLVLERLHDSQELPFLIVLDLHLPNVPGDEILDYISEDENMKDVRIIIASADGYLAGMQQHKNIENILILQKPVSFAQLRMLAARLQA